MQFLYLRDVALRAWLTSAIVGLVSAPARAQSSSPAPAEASSGEVLTRGAIHEAFAAAVTHDPRPGPVIPREPPKPINEVPPDQRPEGRNIQWIPGYWSYDTSRQDFIWISGIWREPPPGCQWVPGYWNPVQGGSQWVPGTWAPAPADPAAQPAYLSQPPASLENGPTSPQPRPDTAWTPGYWQWQESEYIWRPGFWAAVQPAWVWIPAHYVPTPGGWLFVPGYWDLPLANRGLMFAPVYYPPAVSAQPGFIFTPAITIAGPAVTANLFVQAGTGQYYFGDFYGQTYVGMGITPWFSFAFATGPPVFYDPLFSYYSVIAVRQNPRWLVEVREQYNVRLAQPALRPARTYIEQTRILERDSRIARDHGLRPPLALARPLHEVAAEGLGSRRLVRVAEAERRQLLERTAQLHNYREQRLQAEQRGAAAMRAGGRMAQAPRPLSLPRSPIAAHPRTGQERSTSPHAGLAAQEPRLDGHVSPANAQPAANRHALNQGFQPPRAGMSNGMSRSFDPFHGGYPRNEPRADSSTARGRGYDPRSLGTTRPEPRALERERRREP